MGQLLADCQPYLRVMAQRQLDSAVKARIDPSDVVQLTCLDAHRDMQDFRGVEIGEFVAWLRRILQNNTAEVIRHHLLVRKRSMRQEKSMDESAGDGMNLRGVIAADISSPSRRAMRGESAILLAQALEKLPDDQRDAVRLRHLEGKSLAEIAAWFDRSEVAAAGLLKRGLKGLRKHLAKDGPLR